LSWGTVIVSVLGAFVLSGVVAVILLVTGRVSRSTQIAFGPYMILGAWVALMFPVHVMTG
jgi:leader peptidase (prepilin peptidase)/N-methyltransferase